MSLFWLWWEIVFGVTYERTVQQRKTDGDASLNSYVKKSTFFCIPDGQTDGRTDSEINPVWAG